MKKKKKKDRKKRGGHSDDPMIVGFFDGADNIAPQSNAADYMHGWYNGAIDRMRARGELAFVTIA